MINFRRFLIESDKGTLGDAARGVPSSTSVDVSKFQIPPEIEEAEKRFAAARYFLQKNFPFFYTLLAKMSVNYTYDIETMAVDAKGNIFINPEFGLKLTYNQFLGVIIHEVFHIANDTFSRKQHRNHKLWNICTDVIMNRDILDNIQEYMTQHPPKTGIPSTIPELPIEMEVQIPRPDGGTDAGPVRFYTPKKDGDKWVIDITLGDPELTEDFIKANINPIVDVTEMSAEQLYHYCEKMYKKAVPPPPAKISNRPFKIGDRVKRKSDGKSGTIVSVTAPDANGDQDLDIEWDNLIAGESFHYYINESVSTGLPGRDFVRLTPPGQRNEKKDKEQEKKDKEQKKPGEEQKKPGEEQEKPEGELEQPEQTIKGKGECDSEDENGTVTGDTSRKKPKSNSGQSQTPGTKSGSTGKGQKGNESGVEEEGDSGEEGEGGEEEGTSKKSERKPGGKQGREEGEGGKQGRVEEEEGEEGGKQGKPGEKGKPNVKIEEEEEGEPGPGGEEEGEPGPGGEEEGEPGQGGRGGKRKTGGYSPTGRSRTLDDILSRLPEPMDHINDVEGMPTIKRLPGSDRPESWTPEELRKKVQDSVNTGDRLVKEKEMDAKAQQDTIDKLKNLFKPKVDWKKLLKQLIAGPGKVIYTFKKPARRFLGHGIYMPSTRPEPTTKYCALAIDCSGSIGEEIIQKFISEAYNAITTYNATIFLMLWHTEVYFSKEYNRKNAKELFKLKFESGGTDANCIWPYLVRYKLDKKVRALVTLTDGYFEQFKKLPAGVDTVFIISPGGTDMFIQGIGAIAVFLNPNDEKLKRNKTKQ